MYLAKSRMAFPRTRPKRPRKSWKRQEPLSRLNRVIFPAQKALSTTAEVGGGAGRSRLIGTVFQDVRGYVAVSSCALGRRPPSVVRCPRLTWLSGAFRLFFIQLNR